MRSPTSFITALALILSAGSTCLAIDTPEVEGNDSKAAATVVAAMAPGDTISGISTSSTGAGIDTFDITTTPAGAPGIYRYRLVISTTGTAGHTGSIRGWNQTGTYPNGGTIGTTDTAVQTSLTTASGSSPARSVQWYANETPSRIYYRVTGTASTTATYTVELFRDPVTVNTVPSSVDAGPVFITTIGQTSGDTDMWLYDSSGVAITGAGNDDESVLGGGTGATLQSRIQRNLSAGTYVVAIANFNLANHLAMPTDEDGPTDPVMDFPNAFCTSSTLISQDNDFLIGNRCTGASQPISNLRAERFDVNFWSITVAGPTLPDPVEFSAGAAAPANVGQGLTTLLSVTATGGAATAVAGDLSAFGLTSAEAFHDDGLNGDVAAADGIWSYALTVPALQATGAYTVNVSGTVPNSCVPPSRSIALNVTPPNDLCANALPVVVGGSYLGTTLGGTSTGDPTATCTSVSPQNQGVWYSFTETNPTGRILRAHLCDPVTNFDARMLVYSGSCGALTCISGNETSPFGCPIQHESQIVATGTMTKTPTGGFGCPTVPGTTYYILVTNAANNVGGNFVLHLEEEPGTVCGGPSTNNFCSGARPVTTTPFWETARRPNSLDNADVSCNDGANTAARGGVWYTFTPSQNGDLYHTQVLAQTGANDTVLTIYTGPDCSTLTEFACIDAIEGYAVAEPRVFRAPVAQLTAGTTYWMLVSQFAATGTIGGNSYIGFNFIPTTPTCPGNECGNQDYNGDGDFGTDQDIEAFFACLGGVCCPTCFCQGSDFNGDGDFGTDQDIEAFFRVLGGGGC